MEKNITPIPIEISARHVHLTEPDWALLFGQEQLIVDREISQKPQFVAKQRVIIRGPKWELEGIAVVGPFRDYTQAELSLTDAHRLGITPALSDSGNLEGAAAITIVGTAGEISRAAGIVQQRHLHLNPAEAESLDLKDRQTVAVKINGPRGARLDNVLVRVDPSFALVLHLDTDEANACGILPGMTGTIII